MSPVGYKFLKGSHKFPAFSGTPCEKSYQHADTAWKQPWSWLFEASPSIVQQASACGILFGGKLNIFKDIKIKILYFVHHQDYLSEWCGKCMEISLYAYWKILKTVMLYAKGKGAPAILVERGIWAAIKLRGNLVKTDVLFLQLVPGTSRFHHAFMCGVYFGPDSDRLKSLLYCVSLHLSKEEASLSRTTANSPESICAAWEAEPSPSWYSRWCMWCLADMRYS